MRARAVAVDRVSCRDCAAAAGFFAAIVWETARDVRARGWKSSPLALMYHGLDPEVWQRHSGGDLVDSEDMERDSRGLAVRMAQTEKGWVFTEAER